MMYNKSRHFAAFGRSDAHCVRAHALNVRLKMKASVFRSIFTASAFGFIAAVPIVLSFVFNANWLDSPAAEFLVVLTVAGCPPWSLFWYVLNRPDDAQFLIKLGGFVLGLNALLYAPLGALHWYALRFRPTVRRTLVGVALFATLALGHAFFMQEPNLLSELLN